jgi:hypothetical protein
VLFGSPVATTAASLAVAALADDVADVLPCPGLPWLAGHLV